MDDIYIGYSKLLCSGKRSMAFHMGIEHKSIDAIAHALEHINLAYASLGWFMRFPIIGNILQYVIDSLDFDKDGEDCILKKRNND